MISDQEWARQEGIVSFAGHPLVLSDKLVGVMGMFSKKPLNETVLHALKSISDSVALGIERKKAENQIYFLAYYDKLTRLPNRSFFNKILERSLAHAQRYEQAYAVMLIDLNNFNRINDSFGHDAGDDLLKKVSSRLLHTVRSSDCVARIADHEDPVARMGGDEFVVLLQQGRDDLQITHIAGRIRDELSLPYELAGREIVITISVGIALYPGDGRNSENLITNAEAALHHAKKKGQNNFALYSKSMNERAVERLALETELRRAIEKQEFVVYYQPKIDVSTNKIVGSEALVRWKTAEGKMISPGEFIPLAETTGLIVPIGKMVVQMACRQNEIWHRNHGQKMTVAINVSGLQFGQKTFVEDMLTIISESDLDPRYVELEITETTIMTDPEKAVRDLQKLKKAGIRIALDDFGTGYSSLGYLQRLPLDVVKIDMSFITNVATDMHDAAIVKTIITMAHNMNLRVVAEGVEKTQQLDFLNAHACDMIQGYLFSPPLPAEDFTHYIGRLVTGLSR